MSRTALCRYRHAIRALHSSVVLSLIGAISACNDPTAPATSLASSRSPSPTVPAAATIEYIHVSADLGVTSVPLTPGRLPDWSPDGRRITYTRDSSVHVIDLDGSNDLRLAAGTTPAWSPDGARIAFTSAEGISVMNADGSGVTTLVRHDFRDDTDEASDMGVSKPSWSPDGTQIAFEHLGDGDIAPAQVLVMRADGTCVRLLNDFKGTRYAESDPSWSPDGASLVFWSYGSGIGIAAVNGGAGRTVYADFPSVAYGSRPVFHPSGQTIAFNRNRNGNGPEIWLVSSSGLGARLAMRNAYDGSWSPDGERFAFVRKIQR